MFQKSKNKLDIDPFALLEAHQKTRETGGRIVSILVGPPVQGSAVFGKWLTRKGYRGVIVPPDPSLKSVQMSLDFGVDNAGVMIIPQDRQLLDASREALRTVDQNSFFPIAIITNFRPFEKLMKDVNVHEKLRRSVYGGLIPLQEKEIKKIEKLDPVPIPPKPYRSPHEYLLHTLMIHDRDIKMEFKANHQVIGASRKSYEVDLWCAELKLAIEVDGMQHVTSLQQKARDEKRDVDLAGIGVKTRRIFASSVMSDPTNAIKIVKGEIESRIKELTQ